MKENKIYFWMVLVICIGVIILLIGSIASMPISVATTGATIITIPCVVMIGLNMYELFKSEY